MRLKLKFEEMNVRWWYCRTGKFFWLDCYRFTVLTLLPLQFYQRISVLPLFLFSCIFKMSFRSALKTNLCSRLRTSSPVTCLPCSLFSSFIAFIRTDLLALSSQLGSV